MKAKRWIVLGAVLIVSVGIGMWLYLSLQVSAAVDPKDVVTVTRVDFPLMVNATGMLEAVRSVTVGPPSVRNERRFRLSRMVEEGKQVTEGDFLVEFDGSEISRRMRDETSNFQRVQEEYQKKRSDFDIQIREQKLQLAQAKADLDKLENKLNQQVELESAMVIEETRIRLDAARRRVELMEEKIRHLTESGRLDLEISRSNETHYRNRMNDLLDALDAMTVYAPVGGVVIYRRGWDNEPRQVGDFVHVTDSVMEIPDLSSLRVKVLVDEVDAGKIRVGQEARVGVDAVQGKTFAGKVASISAILKQVAYDRPQKVAETMIHLEGEELRLLRPGMSARAQIFVGEHPQAIVIPLASIAEKDGRSFVEVWNGSKKEFDLREIQLVTNDGLLAVVSSGLQAEEQIRIKPKVL